MLIERRRGRSSDPSEALRLWFAATARRSRVPGFFYTASDGRLIASNIPGQPVRQLAALVPALVRRGPDGRRLLDSHAVPVSVLRIGVGPTAGLLCVLGERARRDAGLLVAMSGVRRILSELRAAAAA